MVHKNKECRHPHSLVPLGIVLFLAKPASFVRNVPLQFQAILDYNHIISHHYIANNLRGFRHYELDCSQTNSEDIDHKRYCS